MCRCAYATEHVKEAEDSLQKWVSLHGDIFWNCTYAFEIYTHDKSLERKSNGRLNT